MKIDGSKPEPLDHHGGPRLRGHQRPPEPDADTSRFRWLIDGLPPLDLPDDTLVALAATMVDQSGGGGWSGQPTSADNPALSAGHTYLAQFVDHDITFDPVSRLDRAHDPDALQNFRTPRFDLDSIYGGGPKASPYLYNKDDQDLLLIDGTAAGPRLAGRDLPRNSQERALTGDPRNDVHVIISQLHLALLAFHNAVVAHVRQHRDALRWGEETDFQTACRLVRWHYQWVILHDLLPRITGHDVTNAVLTRKGNRYQPKLKLYNLRRKTPYVPIEFSAAVFRFGHSLVRDSYQVNSLSGQVPLFSADANGADLRGFRRLPENLRVEWDRFFLGMDGAPVPPDAPVSGSTQPSMRLDTRLAPSLIHPPADVDDQRRSIALLNLFRGQRLGLPSGQDFAAAVARKVGEGIPVLTPEQMGLTHQAPLWLYVLGEADLLGGGARLGPVAARVVAEVLVGLAADDPSSLVNDDTGWVPVLPAAEQGQFTIADLLRFAGAGA